VGRVESRYHSINTVCMFFDKLGHGEGREKSRCNIAHFIMPIAAAFPRCPNQWYPWCKYPRLALRIASHFFDFMIKLLVRHLAILGSKSSLERLYYQRC